MQQQTYIIRRTSTEEATYATLVVEFTDDAISRGESAILQLKQRVIAAVTNWMEHDDDGRRAWEDAGGSFNIGDLANEDLGAINNRLKSHGVQIVSLEVDSRDARPDLWVFDDVLAEPA